MTKVSTLFDESPAGKKPIEFVKYLKEMSAMEVQ